MPAQNNYVCPKGKADIFRVLLIDGGARQCLPLIKEFHKKGCEVSALCGSKCDLAYHYKYTDRKVLVHFDYQDEEVSYKPILKEISTGKYDLVIPMVDFFSTILSKHKEALSKFALSNL